MHGQQTHKRAAEGLGRDSPSLAVLDAGEAQAAEVQEAAVLECWPCIASALAMVRRKLWARQTLTECSMLDVLRQGTGDISLL